MCWAAHLHLAFLPYLSCIVGICSATLSDVLNDMRHELKALRHRWYKGEPVDVEMKSLAVKCAEEYNSKAREVAKRMGVKPRLTTPDRILRQCEFLR